MKTKNKLWSVALHAKDKKGEFITSMVVPATNKRAARDRCRSSLEQLGDTVYDASCCAVPREMITLVHG